MRQLHVPRHKGAVPPWQPLPAGRATGCPAAQGCSNWESHFVCKLLCVSAPWRCHFCEEHWAVVRQVIVKRGWQESEAELPSWVRLGKAWQTVTGKAGMEGFLGGGMSSGDQSGHLGGQVYEEVSSFCGLALLLHHPSLVHHPLSWLKSQMIRKRTQCLLSWWSLLCFVKHFHVTCFASNLKWLDVWLPL